jgi:ATP-binding cassette subfamily A (ABC1) protein 1
LKNRFGNGYEVDIKLNLPKPEAVEGLAQYMLDQGIIQAPSGEIQANIHAIVHSLQLKPPLDQICTRLGNAQRFALICPNGDGQILFDQISVDGFVLFKTFLEWWIAEDFAAALAQFMNAEFRLPMLLERSSVHSFRYRIPAAADLPLADVFEKFELKRGALNIKDYSIGQTTLEQIFNQFAASQDNPEVEAQQIQAQAVRQVSTTGSLRAADSV